MTMFKFDRNATTMFANALHVRGVATVECIGDMFPRTKVFEYEGVGIYNSPAMSVGEVARKYFGTYIKFYTDISIEDARNLILKDSETWKIQILHSCGEWSDSGALRVSMNDVEFRLATESAGAINNSDAINRRDAPWHPIEVTL